MQGARAQLHTMVSRVNTVASHAGEASHARQTITSTPPDQPQEVCHTVLLQVAHAHRHGMVNQGKLAAGHVNEASLARNHTIRRG